MFANISNEWLSIIKTNELDNILDSLKGEPMTPPAEQIFEFARLTPFDKIKCVIVGQDPYPSPGDAHGLAFSCMSGIPASLRNIYRSLLKQKHIKELPETGNLTSWAKQGVLLLNTALTTTPGQSMTHKKIWEKYTRDLITRLSQLRPMVFILWGDKAKALRDSINYIAVVLEWGHPSPLARNANFINCSNFTETNSVLVKLGEKPINWNVVELNDDGKDGKDSCDSCSSAVNAEFGNNPRTQVLFTDGSCFPNKSCPASVGGYAAVIAYGSFKDVLFYGNIDNKIEYATNQRAEGFAIYHALEYLKSHMPDWDSVIIITDSQFWIDMFIKYMPSWKKHNKFDEKKNPDLTIKLWDLYSHLLRNKKSISFRHVRSHNKSGWSDYAPDTYEYFCYLNNDYVDKIAEFAREKLQRGKNVISKAKYND